MGRDELSKRENWQYEAAIKAKKSETAFHIIMQAYLEGQDFEFIDKPKNLKGIYGTRTSGSPHGIVPEFMIRNKVTGKAIFIEVKRQQAAGNAHERACKYFTPGIIGAMRHHGKQPESVLPLWCVFTNGIAQDPNYRREIMFWFKGFEANVLLWKDLNDRDCVIDHFNKHILPMVS